MPLPPPSRTMMSNTTASTASRRRLSDEELLEQTSRYERAKRIEGTVKRVAGDAQQQIVGELRARGTQNWDGPETHVTVVSPVKSSVDPNGLWELLGRKERTALYRVEHDLNALPADVQKGILEGLTPGTRKAISRRVLDTEALKTAIASGQVAPAKVAACTTTTSSEPYIRISHGPRR